MPPKPQTPRPKSKASVIESGRSALTLREASETAPSAVGPGSSNLAPVPPLSAPRQVAFFDVLIVVLPVI